MRMKGAAFCLLMCWATIAPAQFEAYDYVVVPHGSNVYDFLANRTTTNGLWGYVDGTNWAVSRFMPTNGVDAGSYYAATNNGGTVQFVAFTPGGGGGDTNGLWSYIDGTNFVRAAVTNTTTNGLWAYIDGTNFIRAAVTNVSTNTFSSLVYVDSATNLLYIGLTNFMDVAGYTNRTVTNLLASIVFTTNEVAMLSNSVPAMISTSNAATLATATNLADIAAAARDVVAGTNVLSCYTITGTNRVTTSGVYRLLDMTNSPGLDGATVLQNDYGNLEFDYGADTFRAKTVPAFVRIAGVVAATEGASRYRTAIFTNGAAAFIIGGMGQAGDGFNYSVSSAFWVSSTNMIFSLYSLSQGTAESVWITRVVVTEEKP